MKNYSNLYILELFGFEPNFEKDLSTMLLNRILEGFPQDNPVNCLRNCPFVVRVFR